MVAALLLVTSVMVPVLGAAADSSLSMDVEQQPDTGEAVVSVTHNGTAVENGTLTVNASGNYSANDSYAIGSSGEVTLPAPEETIAVDLTAEYNDSNVTESVTLVPLSDSLDVTVTQNEETTATVVVSQYDEPVENATVNVSVDENTTYDGTGEYTTDQNGTVMLPAPDESVNVTVTAEYANLSATATESLTGTELTVSVSQDAEGAVTISVRDGGEYVDGASVVVESSNYTYTGSYTAANGTVSLPAPTQNVTVTVTAMDGNETASTTTELTVPTDENPNNDFAQNLNRFIHFMQTQDIDGPLGQEISEFVHAHNPASADDNRGPPAHAGGNAEDDERGPPEHAGANGQNDTAQDHDRDRSQDQVHDPDERNLSDDDTEDEFENETDSADEDEIETEDEAADEADDGNAGADDGSETETDDDDRKGPPEHANGPKMSGR